MNLVGFDYINKRDKELTDIFISSSSVKKYILGINKFTKSVIKHVKVDGIIDDFTRVQSSRKKSILKIEDVPQDALILSTSLGSPQEVKKGLDKRGFDNFNYFSFYRYSKLDLPAPPFVNDFRDDFFKNKKEYQYIYNLLCDNESKEVFRKVLNFKMTFDLEFMHGFTNNCQEQYFDKEIIPKIDNIVFVDGGAYVGDTLPSIIKNFPNFKKIYCIEPSELHINIAKRNYLDFKNIEFINCGLGNRKIEKKSKKEIQNNCAHDFQALNIDTLDEIINEKIDFIKLDIEGAEQDALEGAQNIIKNYKPILAICIYHKAEDWYKVPKKILLYDKDYKIYLRHYMEGIYETVMYFIPEK